jgi:hypothetical protein
VELKPFEKEIFVVAVDISSVPVCAAELPGTIKNLKPLFI